VSIVAIIKITFADPEFEAAFRAYVNYFQDLAGSIGGLYGWKESLVAGVHQATAEHPPVRRVQRRHLNPAQNQALEKALRKSWGSLRRAHRELDDPEQYDEEANAWLPVQSYYATYHAILALAIASGQPVPRDHASALKLIGKDVKRGLLPYPWSVYCEGCPQTGSHVFGGVRPSGADVHVLSRPDLSTSEDRLAMFLRTTRAKELDRRFDEVRRRAAPGRSRRNLSAAGKKSLAAGLAATTLFDILWRMRKKASYDDADAFVLGAAGELDARQFGEALVIVTDATVAMLEGIMGAYVGPPLMSELAVRYREKTHSDQASAIGRRAASWRSQAPLLVATES
jgi:hypothetical protein